MHGQEGRLPSTCVFRYFAQKHGHIHTDRQDNYNIFRPTKPGGVEGWGQKMRGGRYHCLRKVMPAMYPE